jgi:hypothetical protein
MRCRKSNATLSLGLADWPVKEPAAKNRASRA